MIAWLSEWLKQIIIVILLAAFVDLLMPNNGLQRYVRTVLGLFILLTLLTPIFSLFQKSLDTGKLLASVEQLPTMLNGGAGQTPAMKPLADVLQEGNELKTATEQQTMQLLETRLASEMKSSMETLTDVKVKDIQLDLQTDNNGKPSIGHMQAILYNIDGAGQAAPKANASTGRGMDPVPPVRPVQIQVNVGEAKAGDKPVQETHVLKETEQQAKSQVYELLTQQWQLKRTQIQLNYESEQQKAR